MFAVETAEGVATLTLRRPPVNAISEEWLERFHGELDALDARRDWKVLHLRSDQKTFCAGADLKEIHGFMKLADGPDRMFAFLASIQRLYVRLEQLDRVTLAEIGGAAMGGGLELALACDLRVAASEVKVGLPEALLGLIPAAGGTQRLTQLCGASVAARLILCAEAVDGATARELGVVQWAFPQGELVERTREIARRIAQLPLAALAGCKTCLAAARTGDRGGFLDELEVSQRLLINKETQQRVATFVARGNDARAEEGAG
jgi:enoyl-CoA hydratase